MILKKYTVKASSLFTKEQFLEDYLLVIACLEESAYVLQEN